MSTGILMMLRSLGLDPKMLEGVAQAVQQAALDLRTIKEQQKIILDRLSELEQKFVQYDFGKDNANDRRREGQVERVTGEGSGGSGANGRGTEALDSTQPQAG